MAKRKGRQYQRRVSTRDVRKTYLIVCEGKNTEPSYFLQLRQILKLPIKVDTFGEGRNTISLVEQAVQRMRNTSLEYDQVWCVFDKDNFSANDFNGALDLARRNDIRVAYSNEAFELWFVLHFQYLNTAQSRSRLVRILENASGVKYSKKELKIFDELISRMPDAIRNATQLLATYQPTRPATDNPSTTVHLLIEELLSNNSG